MALHQAEGRGNPNTLLLIRAIHRFPGSPSIGLTHSFSASQTTSLPPSLRPSLTASPLFPYSFIVYVVSRHKHAWLHWQSQGLLRTKKALVRLLKHY